MMTDAEINARVQERDRARAAGDYTRADAIKAELLALRYGTVVVYKLALLDSKAGTFWYWTTERTET